MRSGALAFQFLSAFESELGTVLSQFFSECKIDVFIYLN